MVLIIVKDPIRGRFEPRVDVAQKVAKSIKDDCAHAEKSSKPDDHKTITMYKDIVCDQVSI